MIPTRNYHKLKTIESQRGEHSTGTGIKTSGKTSGHWQLKASIRLNFSNYAIELFGTYGQVTYIYIYTDKKHCITS